MQTATYSIILWVILSLTIFWLIKDGTKEITKRILFYTSLVIFIGFYGYMLSIYFTPSHHQKLLKTQNLGGFSNITLYENLIDKTEVKHECQLVLHTSQAITCYFPDRKTYTEFPVATIQRIEYLAK